MKPCVCGSRKFIADITSGDQEVIVDEQGEVVECETTVYATSEFLCYECGRRAKEKQKPWKTSIKWEE